MKITLWQNRQIVMYIGGDPENGKSPELTIEMDSPQIKVDTDKPIIVIEETK